MGVIHLQTVKEKCQTFNQTRNCTLYALRYIWKEREGKTYIIAKEISALLNGLVPLVNMIIPGLIINELVTERIISKIVFYVIICTEKAATLDFSGVAAIFVTNLLLVQCSF